LKKHYKEQL